MKRRDFIGKGITAGVLPVVLNGLSLQSFAGSPLVQFLGKAGNEDRVLVLIQLNGGNDGLNTVIPLDQYSNLSSARSNILIPEPKVLKLSGSLVTGLHPALAEIRSLYDNGKISIIRDVGYPNPNYSHFRATDIWLTASDSNQYLNTGWAGRFLDEKYPNFPTGYPNTNYPDPPAIQIGSVVSPAFQGSTTSLGMAITDPTNFYNFLNGTVDPAPNTPMGHELTFIRQVAQQSNAYATSIKAAAAKVTSQSSLYPTAGSNGLADQLKVVAQLIGGGLKTRIYMVNIGSFDTHSAQVDATSPEVGEHATLLSKVSVAVNAFQDDLQKLGVADRVLGMTFSEFGRRIKSNASLGTDHGSAAPLFMFGNKVKGGFYGNNPIISSTVGVNDNLPMQYDFRSVYTSILKNWFGVSDADLTGILNQTFSTIDCINTTATGLETEPNKISLLENYPNPADDYSQIRFNGIGRIVQLRVFDSSGREIISQEQAISGSGVEEMRLNTSQLPEGIYYYQVTMGSTQKTKQLLVRH